MPAPTNIKFAFVGTGRPSAYKSMFSTSLKGAVKNKLGFVEVLQ